MNCDLPRVRLRRCRQRSLMPMLDSAVATSVARHSALRVETISHWPELEKFAFDWDRLADHFSPASYFVSCDWADCWWRTYGDSYELFVLLCRDDDGRVIGI